jgi:hypothetical protein
VFYLIQVNNLVTITGLTINGVSSGSPVTVTVGVPLNVVASVSINGVALDSSISAPRMIYYPGSHSISVS